jgi:predicted DNA-binding protein
MPKKRKQGTPHLRIRIEPELLARLEKSRKMQGRTLTGEMVHRIEQSFRKSDDIDLAAETLRAAFGGPTGDLLRAFAAAIWLLEKRTGKKWNEDRDTAGQLGSAIGAVVQGFIFEAFHKKGMAPFHAEIAEALRKADNEGSEQ